jgi:hypothetical protein
MDLCTMWRRLGWAILAAGLLAALMIYLRAAALPADDDADDLPSKVDIRQMQEIGGEADVLGVEFNAWFASLWHGKRLACTVGLFSIGGCAFCFWRAGVSQART